MTKKTTTFHITSKEVVVKVLLALLVIIAVSYSVVLLSLTGNAISLKKATISIKRTEANIAKSEREFSRTVGILNGVSVSEFGFNSIEHTHFAAKKDSIASFALLYERP